MMHVSSTALRQRPSWLDTLRRYLIVIAVANLVWECLHLPLYTIWREGSLYENAFAVVHCTLGDVLIALSALVLALFLLGDSGWPQSRYLVVAGAAMCFGLAYTIFSEWLNVVVRASWAYSNLMPVISIGKLRLGLSPIMQWIVIPAAAFALAYRGTAVERRTE
jgi:hypothetical protein